MPEITSALETRRFAPANFSAIAKEMPGLARGQLIGAAIGREGVMVAVEQKPRKANEKAAYGPVALQGSHRFQYVAIPNGAVLVVGTPGIVTDRELIAATIDGFRAILAQSKGGGDDIIFAPIAGETEIYIAGKNGAWTSLTALGFIRVAWNEALRGLIGARRGDASLYFLPLARAQEGNAVLENWTRSKKSVQTGAVMSFPYRVSHQNLGAVPIVTAGGLETVDLKNFSQGELKLVAREAARSTIEVLGDLGENEPTSVALATTNGQGRQTVIVPQTTFRQAMTEISANA